MSDAPHYLQGRLGMRVVLVFAAAYFLSYAFRAINAVIAPALMADLQLSNADLGLLSSAYFVGFACLQLPLGVWLDKYGPRRTESALLAFAALGAAIFASSDTLAGLWLGRALIGIGVSACLMAPLKAYRVWYPVAMLLPVIGWRGVFWVMAAMIILAATLLFLRLKPVEKDMLQQQSSMPAPPAAPGGYRAIFADPYFRRMALLSGVYQGGFMAIQTLWAGPWMVNVLGLSVDETSRVLFLFNLFLMLSYVGLSWWAPRYVSYGGRPGIPALRVVTYGLALSMLIQLAMLLFPYTWAWVFWLIFALVVTVTTLAQTHVSLSFPSSQAGRANSAFNLTLFIGAFGLQWGMGLLIDVFMSQGWSQSLAIRMSWAVYLLLQLSALIFFVSTGSRVAPFTEKPASA
jgi:predicted MFS family arabinose efflux permease